MAFDPENRKELYLPYMEILKDVRQQEGVSQAMLAKATNLSEKYVLLIEGGRRVPSVEVLLALMAEAGVRRSAAEELVKDLLEQFEWSG